MMNKLRVILLALLLSPLAVFSQVIVVNPGYTYFENQLLPDNRWEDSISIGFLIGDDNRAMMIIGFEYDISEEPEKTGVVSFAFKVPNTNQWVMRGFEAHYKKNSQDHPTYYLHMDTNSAVNKCNFNPVANIDATNDNMISLCKYDVSFVINGEVFDCPAGTKENFKKLFHDAIRTTPDEYSAKSRFAKFLKEFPLK